MNHQLRVVGGARARSILRNPPTCASIRLLTTAPHTRDDPTEKKSDDAEASTYNALTTEYNSDPSIKKTSRKPEQWSHLGSALDKWATKSEKNNNTLVRWKPWRKPKDFVRLEIEEKEELRGPLLVRKEMGRTKNYVTFSLECPDTQTSKHETVPIRKYTSLKSFSSPSGPKGTRAFSSYSSVSSSRIPPGGHKLIFTASSNLWRCCKCWR